MARKSRYAAAVQEAAAPASCLAGVYLRLSVEDGDNLEYNSIGNQRKICMNYLKDRSDIEIGKVYVDNGCTGMNYKRPGFQAMFADLEAGKINCVLVKDVSRLGRHYIMTSEYVERVFPQMDVRLICVNDNFDSADPASDRQSLLMPFKLIMNDSYVKDTARKIQSSIHAKMNCGEFLPSAGSVPYGYLRFPEEHTYVIDEESAPVVRRIFEMRAGGMKFNMIARILNQEGIPSPGKLRFDRGLTKAEKYREALWIRGTIRKITKDTVYVGSRVHGKIKRERLGGDKKRCPEEEWRVIQNAHPAIVSQILFDKVQEVNRTELERQGSYEKREDPAEDFRAVFKDKVFCGDCGAKMSAGKQISRKTSAVPNSLYYNCNEYRDSNHQRCANHYIRQEVLMDVLKHFLNQQIQVSADVERVVMDLHDRMSSGPQKRLSSLRGRRNSLEAKMERLLEDLAVRVVDYEEYSLMKAQYMEELSNIEKQEEAVKHECEVFQATLDTAELWLTAIRSYQEIPVVDCKVVETLIERILVFKDKSVRICVTYGDPYEFSAGEGRRVG